MAYEWYGIGGARAAALGAGLLLCAAAPVVAQAPGGGGGPAQPPQPIIIGGKPPPSPSYERCVEVQIGNDSALSCLNQKLKREVDRVNPSINLPPLDARSPDVRVGNVNEAALREQYGQNYGRSVTPYRPAATVYAVPRR